MAEEETIITDDHIEDWDFRRFTPQDLVGDTETARRDLLANPLFDLLRVEADRLPWIQGLVRSGAGDVMTDDEGEYVVLKDPSPFYPENGVAFFLRRYTRTRLRGRLTSTGRREARIKKSLLREWQKYGRLKVTILPRRSPGEDARWAQALTEPTHGASRVLLATTLKLIREQLDEIDRLTDKEPLHP